MTITDLLMLCGVVAALALVPSASVLLVVSQSAIQGLRHGLAAAAGIATGDLVFVVLALGGLGAVTQVLGDHVHLLRYLGGGFVVWYGLRQLWRRAPTPQPAAHRASPWAGYLGGLLLTLGDLKAVFFYAGLFPFFADVSRLDRGDAFAITLVTVVTVGLVKSVYALLASGLGRRLLSGPRRAVLEKTTGGLVAGIGVLLIATATRDR